MKYFIIALLASVATATEYNECDSGSLGSVENLEIPGCLILPCEMEQGSTQSMNLRFSPSSDSSSLTWKVIAIVAGIEIDWNGIASDACASLVEGTCPVASGDLVEATVSLAISPAYPAIEVPVEMKILNDAGDVEACVGIVVQITKP